MQLGRQGRNTAAYYLPNRLIFQPEISMGEHITQPSYPTPWNLWMPLTDGVRDLLGSFS